MTTPPVRLTLDSPAGHYWPGSQLTGRFMTSGGQPLGVRAAELSVLWYTAGKGEEDLAVHWFQRFVDEPARPLDLRVPRRFATQMPASPLSYDGRIVKICWCARLRLFLADGHESVTETPFVLGDVPPPG
jgi:hypothetical protein